jgi:hypothetical protein
MILELGKIYNIGSLLIQGSLKLKVLLLLQVVDHQLQKKTRPDVTSFLFRP